MYSVALQTNSAFVTCEHIWADEFQVQIDDQYDGFRTNGECELLTSIWSLIPQVPVGDQNTNW